MKYTGIILAVAVVCGPGTTVFKDTCISDVDLQPEISTPVMPSDEVAPSEKMPSWQRPDVTIINAPNMATEDAKSDQEKADANAEGKKAAGL